MSEAVMIKAAAIYTKVQAELRNSTSHIEKEIVRIITSSEKEITKALHKVKSFNTLTASPNPSSMPNVNMTSTAKPENP